MPTTETTDLMTNIEYPDHEPVTVQSALNLATNLNLMSVVQADPLSAAELIINGLCQWAVGEGTEPFDYRPGNYAFSVSELLWDAGWDVSWYDLLSGYTERAVEANITTFANALMSSEPEEFADRADAERQLRAFAAQWRQEVTEIVQTKAGAIDVR